MSSTSTPTRLQPVDLRSLRDAIVDTAGTLAVVGAGTAAGWAGRPASVDAVLDTTRLRGIITHNPGDMKVSVRAGTPLRELAVELAEHHQRVVLDAARVAAGATVGGLIATGDAGPAALRYGSLRDLVIGMTMVLSDGTVARSGGHVIKNVAGYDLAKLAHGSYGTLAVIAEVVLRLHPVPECTATIAVPASLAEAAEIAVHVLASPFEPAALEWVSGDPGTLLMRIEGTESAVPSRIDRVRAALGIPGDLFEHRPRSEPVPPNDPWQRHATQVRGHPEHAVMRIGVRPSRLPAVLAALPAESVTAGLGTGVATVALPADPAAVAAAHETVAAAGGTSVLRDRPADLDVPAWGSAPSALDVLRAVKHALDPAGRLGPGRFAPWM